MKQILIAAAIISTLSALTACKKCATCTSVTDDPTDTIGTITDDFCGRGREYSDWITIHERRGWECTED